MPAWGGLVWNKPLRMPVARPARAGILASRP